MDIVLEVADFLFLDYTYAALLPYGSRRPALQHATPKISPTFSSLREAPTPYQPASQYLHLGPSRFTHSSSLPRDNLLRQAMSLWFITWYSLCWASTSRGSGADSCSVFGVVVYFVFATLSYVLVFNHATFSHPKYLKNQIRLEIQQTLKSIPFMAVLTTPFFLAEVQGYSKLYDTSAEAPFALYSVIQFPFFIAFTDFFIYWIHRGLHHPSVYKTLHKPHHKWIMPTPFASHAFHPVDGKWPSWMASKRPTIDLPTELRNGLFGVTRQG